MHDNPKSQLNMFCQRKTWNTIGKNDIIYTCQKFDSMHQATVTLNCLGAVQFAGQLSSTVKEAEQNAARVCLQHYQQEVAALPPQTSKKRKAEGSPAPSATTAPGTPAPVTSKSILNMALGRILKRPLRKEDIVCQNLNVGTGFQCTLQLPGMPGEWSHQAWAGEVQTTHKLAEESAAVFCVAALQTDRVFGPILAAPKAPPVKKFFDGKGRGFGGGGKGGGKGFGKQPQQAVSHQSAAMQQLVLQAQAAAFGGVGFSPVMNMAGLGLPGLSSAFTGFSSGFSPL